MNDFNHGHIQWKSLESAGGDDHQFLLLTQDCFLTQHVLEWNFPIDGYQVRVKYYLDRQMLAHVIVM